jgi:hypothetical protein
MLWSVVVSGAAVGVIRQDRGYAASASSQYSVRRRRDISLYRSPLGSPETTG